ncbi:MAG: GNAT family N-acetyltransferase [Spirochaetales bacterium]|nr:GNAT family N-acetyltransferase [Spirochaetales bacterium]
MFKGEETTVPGEPGNLCWRRLSFSGFPGLNFGKVPDPLLLEFLQKYEYRNLQAAACLAPLLARDSPSPEKAPVPRFSGGREKFWVCFFGDRVAGLLAVKGGLALPLFAPEFDPWLDRALAALPFRENYRTLLGMKNAVEGMEKLCPGPRLDFHYLLLVHPGWGEAPPLPRKDPGEFLIRRAGIEDLEALLPLQRAYELEEVVSDPARFDPLLCRRHFQNQLKGEYILGLWEGGVPLAKGGTNAQGLGFCQVGGVYTVPRRRNQGLSKALIRRLLWEMDRRNRRLCLFVKTANRSALGVYEKTGFQPAGDFKISYSRS